MTKSKETIETERLILEAIRNEQSYNGNYIYEKLKRIVSGQEKDNKLN